MKPDASSLESALAELDALIPDEPVRDVEICSHCFSPEDEAGLAGGRDDMSLDTLASVAAADPFHWGDGDRFQRLYSWLTPRIVREVALDQLHVDEALIASRLRLAGALESGGPAAQAHDKALEALWVRTLQTERRLGAVTFLEYAAAFHPSLEPYLSVWRDQPIGMPDAHAVETLHFWLPDLLSGAVDVGWSDPIDIAEPLTAWILDDGQFRAYRHGLTDDDHATLALFLAESS